MRKTEEKLRTGNHEDAIQEAFIMDYILNSIRSKEEEVVQIFFPLLLQILSLLEQDEPDLSLLFSDETQESKVVILAEEKTQPKKRAVYKR